MSVQKCQPGEYVCVPRRLEAGRRTSDLIPFKPRIKSDKGKEQHPLELHRSRFRSWPSHDLSLRPSGRACSMKRRRLGRCVFRVFDAYGLMACCCFSSEFVLLEGWGINDFHFVSRKLVRSMPILFRRCIMCLLWRATCQIKNDPLHPDSWPRRDFA